MESALQHEGRSFDMCCSQLHDIVAERDAAVELLLQAGQQAAPHEGSRMCAALATALLRLAPLDSCEMLEFIAVASVRTAKCRAAPLRGLLAACRGLLSKASATTAIAALIARAVEMLLVERSSKISCWASALSFLSIENAAALHPYVSNLCRWLADALDCPGQVAPTAEESAMSICSVSKALTISLSTWPGAPAAATEALSAAASRLQTALLNFLAQAPNLSALLDALHFSLTCTLSECLHAIAVCITGQTEQVQSFVADATHALHNYLAMDLDASQSRLLPVVCQKVWSASAIIGCAGVGLGSIIEDSTAMQLVYLADEACTTGPAVLREVLTCSMAPLLQSPNACAESKERVIRRLSAGLTSESRAESRRCLEVLSQILTEQPFDGAAGLCHRCVPVTVLELVIPLFPQVLVFLSSAWSARTERQALELVGRFLQLDACDPALAVTPSLVASMACFPENSSLAFKVCGEVLSMSAARCSGHGFGNGALAYGDVKRSLLASNMTSAMSQAAHRRHLRFGAELVAEAMLQICSNEEVCSQCVLHSASQIALPQVAMQDSCTIECSGSIQAFQIPICLAELLIELVVGLQHRESPEDVRCLNALEESLSRAFGRHLNAHGEDGQLSDSEQELESLCYTTAVVVAGRARNRALAEAILEAAQVADGNSSALEAILRKHLPERSTIHSDSDVMLPVDDVETKELPEGNVVDQGTKAKGMEVDVRHGEVHLVCSESAFIHQAVLRLTRRELQTMCKERKIKANSKSVQLVEELETHFVNTPEDRPECLRQWLVFDSPLTAKRHSVEGQVEDVQLAEADNVTNVQQTSCNVVLDEPVHAPLRRLKRVLDAETPAPEVAVPVKNGQQTTISEQLKQVMHAIAVQNECMQPPPKAIRGGA
mmetsp:Transcript_51956/g.96114  ORF Transcript_51956/g.96114 Transcript_51956/m.96114 type:complete len:894 (-) Transcript_51956:178-2859(-)